MFVRIFSICSFLFMASCGGTTITHAPNLNSQTSNRISLCGGGFTSSTQASLAASLDKVKLTGQTTAAVEQEMKAAILSQDWVTASNVDGIYSKFVTCVQAG